MKDQKELTFKLISAIETYPVRHPVLRAGKPLSSCEFSGDNLKTTFHIGAYQNNQLIGVASLLQVKNTSILNVFAYQLRGMAIANEHQGKGLGKKIINYAETILKEKGVLLLWMNARVSAIPFYTKCGYTKSGSIFEIQKVGPHVVMFKKLN
ncbi:GNAT family N-acetyltransferase [Cellulophaga lytica]|uniref:GNAT family N-acetyltransferase n=1 Tax=Cellulophaga lytica TaxID=979 RepID=UPI000B5CFF8C|nr:GNAT family N-acetyltransferase [Cellulophaga lytica]SNQ44235.1 GCN5-related N-acetyltransferase [Cellulophaga lytica]